MSIDNTTKRTYTVTGYWVHDKFYEPGETITLTEGEYLYWEGTMPGLLEPIDTETPDEEQHDAE